MFILKDYYYGSFRRILNICFGIWIDKNFNDECDYVNFLYF